MVRATSEIYFDIFPNIDTPTPWILQLPIVSSSYTDFISCTMTDAMEKPYSSSSKHDGSIYNAQLAQIEMSFHQNHDLTHLFFCYVKIVLVLLAGVYRHYM